MAALTDKLRKGAPLFRTTLSASMSDSDTTFSLQTATLLPTDTAVDFIIDQVDANGDVQEASLMEVITGVVSGTTVTTDASRRGLSGTDARPHNAGAVVDVVLTSDSWNDLIDAVLVAHNQDGSLKDIDGSKLTAGSVGVAQLATGATRVKLAEVVVSTAVPSVTLSGIPQTYRNLVLVYRAKSTTGTAVNVRIRFNGDSGANYYGQYMDITNGTSVAAQEIAATGISLGALAPDSHANAGQTLIANYTDSYLKQCVGDSFRADGIASGNLHRHLEGGVWNNSAAITSITCVPDSGNIGTGSVYTLYGDP